MPMVETETMNERLQFVQDALRDRCTVTDECARYGISRRVFASWGLCFMRSESLSAQGL